MITPILLIRGNGGQNLLTYDLPGRRLTFWWDRSRNAHVVKFKTREEWLLAQEQIAAARSVRWKVIADYLDTDTEIVIAPPAVDPTAPVSLPLSIQDSLPPTPSDPPVVANDETATSPNDTVNPVEPSPDGDDEERVQHLKDTLKLSELKERAKDLNIPGRAKLTTQDTLARAIAKAEKNPVTPSV